MNKLDLKSKALDQILELLADRNLGKLKGALPKPPVEEKQESPLEAGLEQAATQGAEADPESDELPPDELEKLKSLYSALK